MDRSTPTPRPAGRRLVLGPVGDLVRLARRGVAFGRPASGVLASPPPPLRPPPAPRAGGD